MVNGPPPSPAPLPPPNRTNPWLIAVLVLVVVCCCCVGAIGLIWSFWEPLRDSLNEMGIRVLLPVLAAWS